MITVVVPVYRGLDATRRCLESVARHAAAATTAHELLVIDDASPEPELAAWVASFARRTKAINVRHLRNERNLGFVRTCNRAFRETTGDLVILNSDTIVTAGWLDRLAAVADQPDVATVTPLTNFGSICTLPRSVIDAFALDTDRPRIDACATFVADHSPRRRPAVITGVGFCMLIARRALDAVGPFDHETFGEGYGEEVDFCLRATAAGFRHVVEDSTFVYHHGAQSFGAGRQERLSRSSEIIHRRYPFFRAMNARERQADPLRVSFAALEIGLTPRDAARPHVLQVLHSTPGELGGTEKHFWRLVDALADEFDISVYQPNGAGYLLTTLWGGGAAGPIRRELHIPGAQILPHDIDSPVSAAALRTVLDMFDFDAVHIQNIVHHSLAPLAVLADFDGPVVCSVRDLYLGCPHHWLLYRNGASCGLPEDLSYCATCLPETRGLDLAYLEEFRRTVADRIGVVDHWVFATESARDFLSRLYDLPADRVDIIEHGSLIDVDRRRTTIDDGLVFDEPLRLAYVGIGWAKKGLPAVNQLADELAGTGIEIHHFGELREDISPEIVAHGPYDNAVLPELLDRAGIQVVLLPGPFVETFGHVLTEAIASARPVIGSRWGALGQRIRRHGVGWTIDPEDPDELRDLVLVLDRCRLEVLRATRSTLTVPLRTVADTAGDYAKLYRTSGTRTRPVATGGEVDETERLKRELRAMANVNRQLQVEVAELRSRQRPGSPPKGGRSAPAEVGSGRAAGREDPVGWAVSQARRAQVGVRRYGIVGSARVASRRASGWLRRRASAVRRRVLGRR